MSRPPLSSRARLLLYKVSGTFLSRLYHGFVRPWQDPDRERAFAQLWQSQWWTSGRLLAEQWRSVQRLLHHAYTNVPYYRGVFDTLHAHPEDFREPTALQQFPLLTKETIQVQGERLRATGGFDPKGVYVNHTGGSTGTPLSFWQDANYRAWGMAELDRNFWMCGYRPGHAQAFLWGSDVDSQAHRGLRGKLHDLILNLRWLDTFDLDAVRLRQALVDLVAFQPQLIVGYVSSLTLLARLVEDEGLEAPRPQAVQTSAEVLTPSARALIERMLGAPCFNRYGCREVGNIAHECDSHTGLHLLVESNYTEFISGNGPPASTGLEGEIVVTNLRNYAMPFIRYATQDVGVPSERHCACGRGLPLMDRLQGRMSDTIVAPSGRLLHGEFFTHLFYGMPGIQQFQVEQLTLTDLVVRMVSTSDDAYGKARIALAELIARHGDPVFKVTFERVARIPPRKSGKYCFTLSHVRPSFTRGSSDAVA